MAPKVDQWVIHNNPGFDLPHQSQLIGFPQAGLKIVFFGFV
jgi:hypothetical protein